MNRHGYTLIEIIMVMGIVGVLLTIGGLKFGEMTRKSNIEAQTKMLHGDLMTVRTQAFLQKRNRCAFIKATTGSKGEKVSKFSIYTGGLASGSPVKTAVLPYAVSVSPSMTIAFDAWGLATVTPAPAVPPNIAETAAICVTPSGNPAAFDSIIIEKTRIKMGKRATGAGCTNDNTSVISK